MQNWDLIRAFLALHRAGTFEGAAQLIGVDHSTLRRRIQVLEQHSEETLFSRTKDGLYSLASSKQPLLDAAMQMEASSRSFFEGAAGVGGGVVRLTTIDVFASFLAPDLREFCASHPDIQLEIDTDHNFVDLDRDMVDIAIRLARPTRGTGRLRKLADIRYAIYAAPAYLDARREAPPDREENLLTLAIHFKHGDHDFLAGETAWALERLPRGRIVCGANSYFALSDLCEAGMGLALLPEVLGDARTGLVRLPQTVTGTCDLWLIVRTDTFASKRVRLVTAFVTQAFRRRLGRTNLN